jgi:hypothetical protein
MAQRGTWARCGAGVLLSSTAWLGCAQQSPTVGDEQLGMAADGVAERCMESFPVSQDAVFDAAEIEAAQIACEQDSGPCTASDSMCKGSAANRVCNPARLRVTAPAAVCIAQANGLTDGLSAPQAQLIYNFGYRRIIWTVRNMTYDRSTDATGPFPATGVVDRGGQIFAIDAIDGTAYDGAAGQWAEISLLNPEHLTGLRMASLRPRGTASNRRVSRVAEHPTLRKNDRAPREHIADSRT